MAEIEINCSAILNNNEKLSKLKEVSQAVCALLNHCHGGSVFLLIDDQEGSEGKGFKTKLMRTFLRGIEQRLRDRFGDRVYCSGVIERIEHSDCKVEILVESGKNVGIWLFTIETNLYSPGYEELHKVSSLESLQSILCRIVIWQMVNVRTHMKCFVKNTDSGLIECRTVQLKSLKASASERTTLADRITSKRNKLNCYVSAFANRSGGHVYYGINDDRVVQGELIRRQEDMSEITKKVEKVMKKMIWPEQIGQPTREVHWEIFFEPVVDEKSKPIPSTFVIVIYIAPCLGGVFTEEPECYEMVEGKVKKMLLSDWKIRLFSSLRFTECIPSKMKRITWSSRNTEQACSEIVNIAMESINNGLYELSEVLMCYEEKFSRVIDVKLTIISREVMACLRRGYFEEAYSHLKRYNEILPQSEDVVIFEALLIFLLVGLRRAEGQLNKDWSLIEDLINKTVLLPPGPLTAAIYAICTTVSPEEHSGLSITVLCRETLNQVRNGLLNQDIAQKVAIFGGLYALGCDLSEGLSLKSHYKVNLKAVASSISLCEGQLTNSYRKVQYYILQSMKLVHCSRLNEGNNESCLESARKYCIEAERIAIKCQFYEMINLLKHAKNVCANESKQLVRVRSDGRKKN